MNVEINLLPAHYRDALRRTLWLRRGAAVAAIVIVAELTTGLALHMMGQTQRNLSFDLLATNNQCQSQQQEFNELVRQAEFLHRDLHLATALRASHAWSRLLAAIAEAAPEGVVLSQIATDPAKWTAASVGSTTPAANAAAAQKNVLPTVITASSRGLTIRGRAGDHKQISRLMTGLHNLKLFSTLDLQRMQRDQLEGRDVIGFELQGQW